ncbi:MAG: SPOR domain-containing protein, partial [Bryobacteraceae bacterium]
YPEPTPGQTFLQVAALRRTEAELLVDVLKRKGFPALVAPGPSETLFRVLVGPLKDQEEIAQMRRRLEDAGFRSSYVRKY